MLSAQSTYITKGLASFQPYVLDRELVALRTVVKAEVSKIKIGELTANTLTREVFPAFWSPMRVTSISVDLSGSC